MTPLDEPSAVSSCCASGAGRDAASLRAAAAAFVRDSDEGEGDVEAGVVAGPLGDDDAAASRRVSRTDEADVAESGVDAVRIVEVLSAAGLLTGRMTETGSVAGSGGGGGTTIAGTAGLPAALPAAALPCEPAMFGFAAPLAAAEPEVEAVADALDPCTGATCARVGSSCALFWRFGSTPADVRPVLAHRGAAARQPIARVRIRSLISSVPIRDPQADMVARIDHRPRRELAECTHAVRSRR